MEQYNTPILKFTPDEDGAYYVGYRNGSYEIIRCKAYEPRYLDNYLVKSIRKVLGVSKPEEVQQHGQKSRRTEVPS